MKTKVEGAIDALHHVLKINHERFVGFQKASEVTREPDLKILFGNMAEESKKNVSELMCEIRRLGGLGRITLSHQFHRTLIYIKSNFFPGSQGRTDTEDDSALAAYHYAISSEELTAEARRLLQNQQIAMKTACSIMNCFKNGHHLSYSYKLYSPVGIARQHTGRL